MAAGEGFWVWIALTAICFGIGFGLSWIQFRKRVLRRYEAALEQEVKQRLQQEILRRIAHGPDAEAKPKVGND